MDTQSLIEILTREVLKEIARREKENLSENERLSENEPVTFFLGNDTLLKDELKKITAVHDNVEMNSSWEETEHCENGKKLVVSEFCINNLINLSQGRKSIITEYLFNKGEVFLVEEGLEYKKYSEPAELIKLYDGYLEKVKSFGIKVLKRAEVKNIFYKKEKVYIDGMVTESKLKASGIKNQTIVVKNRAKITSLAMDYIKENNIDVYYERGQ